MASGDFQQFDQRYDSGQPPPPPGPPRSSGKALASLLLGLASFCFSIITGIPAIILGLMAIGDVNRGGGRVTGKGSAVFGILTGILGSLCFPCIGVASYAGIGMLNTQIQTQLADNPVIREHIGTIESCSWDFGASMEAQQGGEADALAFQLRGSKGSGVAIVKVVGDKVTSGKLKMPNGETKDLFPDRGAGDRPPRK